MESRKERKGIQVASYRIEASIEGTTPLLCNRFSDASAAEASGSAIRLSTNRDKGTPKEQAEHKLYIGISNKPMIPQPNMFRCIIDAGIYFKAGKSKVTTQKSSLVPACLELEGSEIPILHKEPWTIDTRAVRIPSTGGRILCHRPCFHDWKLSFIMVLDTDLIPLLLIREILDAAGRRIGLGDFRPACKGPFGKFVVNNWKVVSPEKESTGKQAKGDKNSAVGRA